MEGSRLPRYVGKIHPNCDYIHGQIPPARGVKCWQVTRANPVHPEWEDGVGYTYKHAPDLCWFHGKFYIQYLTNPVGEHTGAGLSILASSADGAHWGDFTVSFPHYRIPACQVTDYKGLTHTFTGESYAFMHQRMCFYQTKAGRMLVLGFYGWSPDPTMVNWDNYGIGRVVRELYPDGSLGDIYFICPNWQGGWSEELLQYPLYQKCPDKSFVAACEELLADPLATQQWAEENGDKLDIITVKHPENDTYQAFCWYHIDQDTVIGLWKHSYCARSNDNGKTWGPVQKSYSLVMSGQKVWGCRTSDGRFAMAYDPTLETQHRYPMCVTTSQDGLDFDHMLLVCGDLSEKRYPGMWKDFGFQYMRGIAEGLERPGKDLYLTYSVNKEDIWFAQIPVPITGEETENVHDDFQTDAPLAQWNLYSPLWARAEWTEQGLRLSDKDPYDYCKAERVLPLSAQCQASLTLTPEQNGTGCLYVEFCTPSGEAALRLVFRADGKLYARTTAELPVASYQAGQPLELHFQIDCETFQYTLALNGKPLLRQIPTLDGEMEAEEKPLRFMRAANAVSRLVLRTAPAAHTPTLDMDPEETPAAPLPGAEEPVEECAFLVHRLDFTCTKPGE